MENSNEKKETRGGRREGAGRKPKADKKANLTITISPEARTKLERYAAERNINLSQAAEQIFSHL